MVKSGRITQRRIAELAGVSQATVSLVLNGKADDEGSRIPEETRRRVRDVIAETGYVPDPAARRLAGVGNRMIGVFTYEPAFPSQSIDFYAALLTGIESQAEKLGCDLVLFTSAPVENGRRSLFHPANRLRLADGCLLLGQEMDAHELERLVESGFPFVAVGRRDVAGVPYIAADYVTGTSELVREAWRLGHRAFAYVRSDRGGEAMLDRRRGFETELARLGAGGEKSPITTIDQAGGPEALWSDVRASKATVVITETAEQALAIVRRAAKDGVRVPADLSVIALADPTHAAEHDPDVTRLSPPRSRLGGDALHLLSRLFDPGDEVADADLRVTLPCDITWGSTLAVPSALDSDQRPFTEETTR